LADLLELLNHTRIDNLYTRFEVNQIGGQMGPNKLQKASYLVDQLSRRGSGNNTLMSLVNFIGSDAFGVASMRRGAPEAREFYDNLDRDLEIAEVGAPPARSAERQTPRASTTAPTPPRQPTPDAASARQSTEKVHGEVRRTVFVIRGRDGKAYAALVRLLRALDLRVITWEEATLAVGSGSPHTLTIVEQGIKMAHAVVALFTPDDLGRVKPEFLNARDSIQETRETGQARQNVVFEAGWAMALRREEVILVRVGDVRPLSDIEGLNYVWLTNRIDDRRTLLSRLRTVKLAIDDQNDDWRTAGDFPDAE
jgi:predicted nucleotide-binding protein